MAVARQELALFLRDRREHLRPAEVGRPGGSRRRTSGLRREEVAELAHMSVEYYARLEQARAPRPSPRILHGIAGALRLTPTERAHLFGLAGTALAGPDRPVRAVRPHVAGLLARMTDAAAVVTDAGYDVIAFNPLAEALLGGLHERPNLARRRFLGTNAFTSSSAEEFGHIAVARLRAAAARYPHDESLAALLAELRAASPDFMTIWDTHPVHSPGHRTKTIEHDRVGRLRLNCDVLTVPEVDQQVVFITADPGTPDARALRQLQHASR